MITDEQFEELLALKHEIPGIEFKGPGSRKDSPLLGKVIRAAMSMANRRDGGLVIIGVSDHNGVLSLTGLSDEQLSTWRYDDIADGFAAYADPPISFDFAIRESNGMKFVVLQIHEFIDVPIICKKEYRDESQPSVPFAKRAIVLRKGTCYIRSRHKPETLEVSSVEHMRELIDLATEKGVRRFVTQVQKAGMSLLGDNQRQDDSELFNRQVSNTTSSLLEKIWSRGYWKIIIRQDKFSQEKIAYDALYPLVEKTAVSIYDERFPNIAQEHPPLRGSDYIGQEIARGHFIEAWYLYQSGQFIDYSGILDDWIDQSDWVPKRPGWEPGKMLSIEEVVRQLTCIFMFASRLALTDVYADDTHIYVDVLLKGSQGRKLYIDTPGRVPLRRPYDAQIPEFHYTKRFQRDELIANSKELALSASRDLFLRFGWNVLQANLEGTQSAFNLG